MAATVFKFRFQKILNVREKQQRALEIELARLDRAILTNELTRRKWHCIKQDTLNATRLARHRDDLAENARCAQYLRHVRAQAQQCQSTGAQLRGNKEHIREELQRVMQSCKMLEKYRDRLKAEFMAAQEKAEERALDAHSIRAFVRAEEAA